jgi:hypothetical protein
MLRGKRKGPHRIAVRPNFLYVVETICRDGSFYVTTVTAASGTDAVHVAFESIDLYSRPDLLFGAVSTVIPISS